MKPPLTRRLAGASRLSVRCGAGFWVAVMTRLGQLNRKGSSAGESFLLRRSSRKGYAEAILEKSGVARGQDSRRFSLIDFDDAHGRALPNPVNAPGKALKIALINDDSRISNPAAAGRRGEVGRIAGVALLAPGLAIGLVVEHGDREIARVLRRDRRQRAEAHEEFAVAGDDEHRPSRLRKRKPEPDHRGAAHRAPKVEVERMIASGGDVVGRRAEPGDDQQVAPALQQPRDGGAAVERLRHFANTLAPMRRCDRSTAVAVSASKAMMAAAPTTSATSAGASARITWTPAIRSASGVAVPIGTCHGLNSPHSPRIVTRVRNGKRPSRINDSMLTQLPTPLDCIRSALRSPPSQAPAHSATPSSSVVSTTGVIDGAAWTRSISRVCPASGT